LQACCYRREFQNLPSIPCHRSYFARRTSLPRVSHRVTDSLRWHASRHQWAHPRC